MIKFIKNIYVIDNFKINLLIKMNIFNSKKKIIDFFKKKHNFREMSKCFNIYIIYVSK